MEDSFIIFHKNENLMYTWTLKINRDLQNL